MFIGSSLFSNVSSFRSDMITLLKGAQVMAGSSIL